MQIYHDAWRNADLPKNGIVTIGKFDGIHLGQQKLIKQAIEHARSLDVPACAMTFDPHPLSVLRPEKAPALLTTNDQRYELLEATGLDALLVIRFSQEFLQVEAEDFIRDLLHNRMDISGIYLGPDFRFGNQRRGDVEMLRKFGAQLDFEVHPVEPYNREGEPVSSTRIRRAVGEGRVEQAMEMLGRPYALRGKIGRGDRMGQKLGWPTANLVPEGELLPADGVYACRIHFPSFPATFDAATNVGTRPTVYENYQQVVESHILDFGADVYGEKVEVRFFKRLREEKLFPTVMDLSAQISRDVDTAREYFATRRRLLEGEEGEFTS